MVQEVRGTQGQWDTGRGKDLYGTEGGKEVERYRVSSFGTFL